MSYSLDSGGDIVTVQDTFLKTDVSAGTGEHVVHVKAWGVKGAVCVSDVTVKVTAETGGSPAPPGASSVSSIQSIGSWEASHDRATGGSSWGSTELVNSPSRGGSARRFITHFANSGGERYYVDLGDDEAATNFLYDGYIYIADSASSIYRIEMDVNQVMPNGQTAIFGIQCDGQSGRWDYTVNRGSAKHYEDKWVPSSPACNPREWSVNTWHHVQFSYSRNDSGVINYKYVMLDGAKSEINATVFSGFELRWPPLIITNFQIDGYGSGTSTVYLDDLTISRW